MTAKIILVEAQPARASDGVAETVRFAGGGAALPYRYDGQDWRAGISALPAIFTSLNVEQGDYGTGAVPRAMELIWAPARNADLAAMAAYFWPDAPVTVRIGDEGATPPITVAGKIIEARVEKGTLKLMLADPAMDIKKPVLTARFAGTGDLEGPVEWQGKIKPRIWGRVWNRAVEPIDKANNIYCVADPARPLLAIDAVRDKGAAAAAINILAWQGSMAATLAALRAAVAPAGGCVVAPSIACLKWWTQPELLHVDVRGEVAGGYVETAASIAARVAGAVAGPAFAAGTVAAADAARADPVGVLIDDDRTTAAQVIDAILGDVSLLWLLDGSGNIIIRPWGWGVSAASVRSEEVERKQVFRPVATTKIGYKRNQSPIARGSLAAIVLAGDVNYADGTPVEALKPAEAGATLGAQAGTNLVDSGGVTLGDGAIKNLAISIGSNGALTGAGGGQVTIGGLANANILNRVEKPILAQDHAEMEARFAALMTRLTALSVLGTYENLLLRSQEFDNASWSKAGLSVSAVNDRADQDGAVIADKISWSAGGQVLQQFLGGAVVAGTSHTVDIWVYCASAASIMFGFYDNVAGGQYATAAVAANQWTLLRKTATIGAGASDKRIQFLTPSGSGSLWLSKAALRKTATPPYYVPTTSATVSNAGGNAQIDTAVTARDAYRAYIYGLSPAWDDLSQDTAIVRATYQANIAAYRAAMDALDTLISQTDATLASWTGVSARPTDLAGLNATEGAKLAGVAVGATVGARAGANLVDSGGAALGDSAIKNLAISIGSNGALTGAGGGQVTIGGLGYTGELNADLTRTAQVLVAPPPPQIIQRDWQGAAKSGQLPRTITPVVTRGGTSIRTDNPTTYAISASGVTATVNNINGSADKGRIEITAGGPGTISLTVTRDSIAYGPYAIPVTVEDDAPPSNGGSGGGSDSTLEDVNSTSFVQITSADSGESIFEATITAGQKLKGVAPLTYNWSHNSASGTNKLVAKWQYSSDGGATWTDFDSAITGSDASWSAVDLSGEPGSIAANQEKSGLSAGTYKARLVGAKNSSSGNAITIATGAATLSVTS